MLLRTKNALDIMQLQLSDVLNTKIDPSQGQRRQQQQLQQQEQQQQSCKQNHSGDVTHGDWPIEELQLNQWLNG
jgi:hypothetical protein